MTIRARPLHVSLPASAPRHWYGGHAFETHFFNALSSLLPEGERFIMQATRHFADRLVQKNQQEELEDVKLSSCFTKLSHNNKCCQPNAR